jgi:hypothetical protein
MFIVVIIIAIVLVAALLVFVGYDAIHGVGPGSAMDSLSDSVARLPRLVMDNKEWSVVLVVGFVAVVLIMNRVKTGRH